MAVKVERAEPGAETERGAPRGLVWAFLFRPDGAAEELRTDRPLPRHPDGWLWLHFDLPEGEAPRIPPALAKLPREATGLLAAGDERQQLHGAQGCIFGVFANLIGGDRSGRAFGFVHFAMTETLLVSNRGQGLEALNATRKALREGRKIATVAGLLVAILEHAIDAVDDHAERLADSLDAIEEGIVAGESGDERARLGAIRRDAVRLHRQLAMSRSLVNRFQASLAGPSLPFDLPFEKLGQRLDWLDGEAVALRDRAHLLQEEVTLGLAEETNRKLEVLSIVATIFLPAGLVAGIFGMNVKGLPLTATDDGFLWSMGILIGATVLVFWLLRRAGAIGRKTP